MKQGLSLRVSQHLALTPQLQQSIRLLQLSTLDPDRLCSNASLKPWRKMRTMNSA